MGLATHLGPWLLGTVKNTTNAFSGTLSNVGATTVAQSKLINYNDNSNGFTKAFVLPAGALITSIQLIQTTTFTGTTGNLNISITSASYPTPAATGTTIATNAITTGTAGILTFTPGTATQASYFSNVSYPSIYVPNTNLAPNQPPLVLASGATFPLDAIIYYTTNSLTAGVGTLVIAYMVRNLDGTYLPQYNTAP